MNVENASIRGAGSKIPTLLLFASLLASLVLSVLSGLKICSTMCSETATYSVFGLDFGWFGTGFFGLMILLLSLRRYLASAGVALLFGVLAAAGAEARLIWIQKFDIGSWCPVCLSIAAAVILAALVVSYELLAARTIFGGPMKATWSRFAVMLVALTIGFGTALAGVQKEAVAAELDVYLGKRKSDTTVYFVSDWFCSVCRKIEPEIEKMYPELTSSVRVAFIDMPIHPESANFTPYHLQFMLYEKDKYISLRHALDKLSRTAKAPTPDQVQAAVTPFGVTLKAQNFMEILGGVRQFETIYKGFAVTATPTVVVDNSKTKKRKLLVGGNEISRNAIKAAIAEVEK
jgi:protein-disulfide isomerase/uncharacterized membrane protein